MIVFLIFVLFRTYEVSGIVNQTENNTSNGIDSTAMINIPDYVREVLPHPRCELYTGKVCRKYLENQKIYVPTNTSQFMIETKLENAFRVISLSNDLSKSCEAYAIPSLCYLSFPMCKRTDIATPESICRDDCIMLQDEICRQEYAISQRHKQIGQVVNLANCTTLPSTECRHLGLPTPEPPNTDEECYRGDGVSYRGIASDTLSGKKCLIWSHQLNIKTADYPMLLGGHRFCRNPFGRFAQPWCFTQHDSVPKPELCNIPECDNTKMYILIITTGGLVFALSVFTYYYCIVTRCKRNRRNRPVSSSLDKSYARTTAIVKMNADGSVCDSRLETSSLIPSSMMSSQKSECLKVAEYHLSNIKFLDELGEGAFGKVYKGELVVPGKRTLMVAIKTLKENATPKTVSEFKREVELMSELHHPNIICLMGVCLTNRLCMLFEYMAHGDLHEFLISRSPTSDIKQHEDESSSPPLEQNDLINIAIQIAAGMEYLCSHHFVHRDLATRNCLVGDNLTVKISDFGLSRDIYSSDYYRVQKSALLPIRWMSPESILYGKFTIESDIWSFGVVLWEIFSYGLQPYYAHTNQDVVNMIRSHQVLSCPEGCPSRVYALMIECWNQIPIRRPQFSEIHSRLMLWRNACGCSSDSSSQQSSHIPVNYMRQKAAIHACV